MRTTVGYYDTYNLILFCKECGKTEIEPQNMEPVYSNEFWDYKPFCTACGEAIKVQVIE